VEEARRLLEELVGGSRALRVKIKLSKLGRLLGFRAGFANVYDVLPDEVRVGGRRYILYVGEGTRGKYIHAVSEECSWIAEQLGLRPLREHREFVRRRLGKR